MAESILNPTTPMNNEGDSILAERESGLIVKEGLSEDLAALKGFAHSEVAANNSTARTKQELRDRVIQSLTTMGESKEVTDLEEQNTAHRQMRYTADSIQDILGAGVTQEQAVQSISEAVRAGVVPVEEELLIRLSETASTEPSVLLDEPNSVGGETYQEWVKRTNAEKDAVDMAVAPIVAGLDPSFQSLLGDFLAEAAPFALSYYSSKVAGQLAGEGIMDQFMARVQGFLAPGEVRHDIQNLVMSVPPEDRPKFAAQLATMIRDKSGIIFDNDTETIDWIENVISSADERNSDSFNWDRTLYNLITLVDAFPFLSRVIRNVATGAKSFMSAASKANRVAARKFLLENAQDANTLRGLTVDPTELAAGQLPKTSLKQLDSTPSIVNEDLGQALANVRTVVGQSDNNAINFTAKELKGVTDRLATAYQTVKGGVLNVNKFVVDVSQGDRVLTDAFYTRTKNESGWLSGKSALNAAEKITDGDLSKVTMLVREEDGSITRVMSGKEMRERFAKSPATPDGNEYFIQVKDTHYLSESDLVAFGDNPVFFTGPFGSGRFLGDAVAQFSKEVWQPSFKAMGQEQLYVQTTLDLAKVFWKLPRAGRNRVTRLLEQGAKDKRVYTPEELVELSERLEGGRSALTVGDVNGYYAMRAANDAVWATANREVYREMKSAGFRSLAKKDGTESFIVRPHSASDGRVRRAYNPKTGKIQDVTPELLALWEKKGGGIWVTHSNSPHRMSGEQTRFIIRDGGTTTQMDALPLNVLRYEDGYVSRVYKDNYFVSARNAVKENGQVVSGETVVHTARTQKEAEDVAAELTKSTGIEHVTQTSLADPTLSRLVNDTLKVEQDRLVFGPRLPEAVTRAGTNQAMLADPIESLHRAVAATGRSIGIEKYVQLQETKFIKTYGDIITPNVWQEYRTNRVSARALEEDLKNFAKAHVGPPREKALEALQLWQYYRMLRGMSEPASMRAWRAGIRSLMDKLERTMGVSPGVSKALQDIGVKHDPFSIAKSLTFNTLIVGNPIRQLALQSWQFSYVAGANPLIALASVRHAPVIRIGLTSIDTPNWPFAREGLAKTLRLTEDEVETMVRQFKNSGLVAELNSYAYMGAVLTDPSSAYKPTLFGASVNNVRNAISTPFRIAKRVGFDEGETWNLSFTYTFALKDHLRKTGKRVSDLTQKEWQQIGADASGKALAMHKAGTLRYQQGLLSVMTQFWSIGHKAMAGMIPGKYGSKAFTPKQKMGMIAAQLGMYGATGVGLGEVIRGMMTENGILDNVEPERASELVRIIETGMLELMVNHMLGDDADLSIAGSFAPTSAAVSTVQDFLTVAFDLGLDDAIAQGTAAGSTFGRYADMFRYIRYTLAQDEQVPNTPSKLERIMRISPTVFSGYSNALKAFYAMRTGMLVSTYGDQKSHATFEEAVARGLFGIPTGEELDVRRLYGLPGGAFSFSRNTAEEIASRVWEAMNKNLLVFEGNEDFNFNRLTAAFEGERLILELLQPHEKEQVKAAFFDLATKTRGQPTDVLSKVVQYARDGAVTPEKVYREVRITLQDPKYDQEREAALNLVKDMIEGRDERTQWYLEQNKTFTNDFIPKE